MLGKDKPEAILLAFLLCYGIAAVGDGLVSVPWGVLAGTSLDNRWRARVFGLTVAGSGVIMLGASPLIGIVLSSAGPAFPNNYALIFAAAGLFCAPFFSLFVRRLPGGRKRKDPIAG
jgi:MFS family permease